MRESGWEKRSRTKEGLGQQGGPKCNRKYGAASWHLDEEGVEDVDCGHRKERAQPATPVEQIALAFLNSIKFVLFPLSLYY